MARAFTIYKELRELGDSEVVLRGTGQVVVVPWGTSERESPGWGLEVVLPEMFDWEKS